MEGYLVVNKKANYDAIVIGTGFSGMYMLHLLRKMGLRTRAFETGADVGGVWYWNRYPGLRCDSESVFFNYTFSEELYKGWTWSSRYPEQPEILRYLNYVADKLDLRKDIQFNTKIVSAIYNEESNLWDIETSNGEIVNSKYIVTGLGTLSDSNVPNLKGLGQFEREWHHTGKWPHEPVDFSGKRVGVIGTGSSGIQVIPIIAESANHLTVFQRSPQYTIPARNKPLSPEYIQEIKENFQEFAREVRYETFGGAIVRLPTKSVLEVTEEERQQVYKEYWEMGGPLLTFSFTDLATSPEANKTASDFVKQKIRETVKNPVVAEKLIPNYPIGAKRIVVDTGYYKTFNRDNVTLHDVKEDPIIEITSTGIQTNNGHVELDMIVFATGYDAITGPLLRMNIQGRNGITLKEKWDNGKNLKTLLGVANNGFPNMFTITGPQSPAVLGNVPVLIEQHVEWIAECIRYLEENNIDLIESTKEAEDNWAEHTNEVAKYEFYSDQDSWYTGANIEGKEKAILVYRGGFQNFRQKCDEVANSGYKGFNLVSYSKQSK